MIRQVISTASLAAVLGLGVGTTALAQQAIPGTAKKPVATQSANPCAAKTPLAAKKSGVAKGTAEATSPSVAKNPWSHVSRSFADYIPSER